LFAQPGLVPVISNALGGAVSALVAGQQDTAAIIGNVIATLQASAAVQTGLGAFTTDALTGLLGDATLWAALGEQVSQLLITLGTNAEVQDYAAETVSELVAGLLVGNPVASIVGDAVGAAVAGLLASPGVVASVAPVIGAVVPDLFDQPGLVSALTDAVGPALSALFSGYDSATVIDALIATLRASSAIQDGVGAVATDALSVLLGDATLWNALGDQVAVVITTLGTNTEVQQYAAQTAADIVSGILVGTPVASIVGDAVGAAVAGLLASPGVAASLGAVIGGLLPDFFAQAGLATAIADAVGPAVSALVAGQQDTTEIIDTVIATLRSDTAIQEGIGTFATDAVTALLGDAILWDAFGTQVSDLIDVLATNPEVQAYAGQLTDQFVTGALSSLPTDVVDPVASALGSAVVELLAIPAFTGGVAAVVGAVVPTLLNQPGLVDTVAVVAGQLAAAVVAGQDTGEALQEAITYLESDPVILSAVGATISVALGIFETMVLDAPEFQQGLGAILTGVVNQILGNQAVVAYVLEAVGEPFAEPLAVLLTNQEVTATIADALGVTVTDFLAYPGFNAAFVTAVNLAVDRVLSGVEVSTAISDAVTALQADPDFQAAVYAVIPTTVAIILGDRAVRQAASSAVAIVVTDLLREYGITIGFLDAAAGRVVGSATEYLLGQLPTWNLIDTIASDIIVGKIGADDILGVVTNQFRTDPGLQIAVGMAVGAGVGFGLLGDNIFGFFVFLGVGATASVGIVAAVALVNLVEAISRLLFGGNAGVPTPNPAASLSESHVVQISTVSDYYVMHAIAPHWHDAESIHPAAAGYSQLALADLKVDIAEAGPDAVTVSMTFDAGTADGGRALMAPLMVDISFPVGVLFPSPGSAFSAPRPVKRRQFA
ncbi:MAG: hypothetical protein O3A42_09330, partial [Actinobacteria bacterium]|nr:hypothetical protein [Actinomycetota bacterium]